MKYIVVLSMALLLAFSNTAIARGFLPTGIEIGASGPQGPAPNSGDGVSDGSGLDSPNGPNSGK